MTKLVMFLVLVLFLIWLICVFGFSLVLWAYLFAKIWETPTLGTWSFAVLFYSSVAYAMCLLWMIRSTLPMPFKDMHVLQELRDLKESDPAAYARRVREVYGPNSH